MLAEWATTNALASSERGKAARAVDDPGQLAELLTAEMHRRGFDHIDASVIISGTSWICIAISWHTWFFRTMHKARAIFMLVLELPEGAAAGNAMTLLGAP